MRVKCNELVVLINSLKGEKDMQEYSFEHRETILHTAVRYGWTSSVKKLMKVCDVWAQSSESSQSTVHAVELLPWPKRSLQPRYS